MDVIYKNMLATTIAEIITLPICTIKTNHQVYNNKSMMITINNIYKTGGMMGFYQASIPAVISQVLSTTSKYTFYRYFTNLRNTNKDDIFNNSINGIMGGIAGSVISHPVDVWKNYKQRNESYTKAIKKYNYKILYQGYSQSLLKNIVLYSILYPVYDYYYYKTNNNIVSSIGTTITVGFITQPLDYLKTRYMAGLKDFHIKDLYKGYHLMLFRNIPHFLITMTLINEFNKK